MLKALKPKETDLEPRTLGEQLWKRRKELGLTQKQAAALLGVTPFTVLNWERGKTSPEVSLLSAVVRFIGSKEE